MRSSATALLILSLMLFGCGKSADSDSGSSADSSSDTSSRSGEPTEAELVEIANEELNAACKVAESHLRLDKPAYAEELLRRMLNGTKASKQLVARQLLNEALIQQGKPPEKEPETIVGETNPPAETVADTGTDPNLPSNVETRTPLDDIASRNEPDVGMEKDSEADAPPNDPARPEPVEVVEQEPFVVPEIPRDQQGVEKVDANDAELSAMIRAARAAESAREALLIYERYLSAHNLTDKQQERITDRHETWKTRAAEDLVRAGTEWVTREEREEKKKAAVLEVEQALRLLEIGSFDESKKLLETASRTDPGGIRADFILGMVNSMSRFHHPPTAEKHFREVLRRDPDNVPALNNLAVTEIKLRKEGEAIQLWERASELAPRAPEISQNLGRLLSVVARRAVAVEPRVLKRYSSLYADITTTGKALPAADSTGYLFMQLPERQDSDASISETSSTAYSSGTAFVVASGYLLTTSDVIHDRNGKPLSDIRIVDPADPTRQRELDASVHATSKDSNLVLLKCEELRSQPLQLAGGWPSRGQAVLAIGFPHSAKAGRNVQSSEGKVASLPDPAFDNKMLFDIEVNAGNSGGPVLNTAGQTIAILQVPQGGEDRKHVNGISVLHAWPFLREHLPNSRPAAPRAPVPDWDVFRGEVESSVVMVVTYQKAMELKIAGQSTIQTYLEDRTCPRCIGTQFIPCPQDGCNKGKISVKQPYTRMVGQGSSARPVTTFQFIRSICPTCRGKNAVDCNYCTSGTDPNL